MVVEKTPTPNLTEPAWPILTLGFGGSAVIKDMIKKVDGNKTWIRFWLFPLKDFLHIYRHQINPNDYREAGGIYWDCPEEFVKVLTESPTCKRYQAIVGYKLEPAPLSLMQQDNLKYIKQLQEDIDNKDVQIARMQETMKDFVNQDWKNDFFQEVKDIIAQMFAQYNRGQRQ
jgi:hypothetical protein